MATKLRSHTITVEPSNGVGAAYDIYGEWTVTVFTLCYACSGTQTPTIHHNDFTKIGNAYEFTFTAPASSKVDFLLRFDKADNSAALDNGNVPKLTLSAYSACDEAIPNGQILRAATISGTTYNLLCDMNDLEKLAIARDNDGKWYVKSSYSVREVTGAELTAYQALSSQNFYVMNDVIAPANYIFSRVLEVAGLVDMSMSSGVARSALMPAFSGIVEGNGFEVDALLVGYVNGSTLRNIKLKDMRQGGASRIFAESATLSNVTVLSTAIGTTTTLYSHDCGKVSVVGGNLTCQYY